MDYQARRQAQAQSTRSAILEAAGTLSRQNGFDKLTIRDICRAAGVTTGAFYHHFDSKEDLLNQGFASLDAFMEKALAPYASAPPLDRLEALLRLYAQFMEAQGWQTIARYYQRRLADPGTASMSPHRYTLRTMDECLRALAQQGITARGKGPQWTADFFFRHFRGTVIDWILHQGSYPLWPKLEQDYVLFAQAFRAS